MPRDAFGDYDEPVNIVMEPEEALKLVLTTNPRQIDTGGAEEVQEQ